MRKEFVFSFQYLNSALSGKSMVNLTWSIGSVIMVVVRLYWSRRQNMMVFDYSEIYMVIKLS